MKPFDYYSKAQTLYPNKKDYITFYVYDKGACIYSESSLSNTKSNLKEDYPNAVIQEVLDEEAYKEHRKQYEDERNKLYQEFQNDLFEEYGVSDNPKRFLLLTKVEDLRDSYSEVYDLFGDLVELIVEE